ncbi:hypothetical protein MIPYR_20472 [uncultured Microbacterium sp.]|uniref:Uncharacterized protein n=1 Tax=uncultured Microbacterium sp. TaxID=191216 RepID=A0A1Y5P4H7_9MICO|nr:hypothetical protein MIPYR_20472 [uncultured Microbacterium sp.]
MKSLDTDLAFTIRTIPNRIVRASQRADDPRMPVPTTISPDAQAILRHAGASPIPDPTKDTSGTPGAIAKSPTARTLP